MPYRNFKKHLLCLGIYFPCHVGPCHNDMARPRIADGGDGFQIWKVAAKILNKQSRTTENGWSSSFGILRESNNSLPYKENLLRNFLHGLGLG